MSIRRLFSYSSLGFSVSRLALNLACWVVILSLTSICSLAQDSRTVTEPSFPPSCVVLTANQIAGSLDETNFDTARVQSALNSCPAGQAVELAGQSGNNAFLIQPLTIPSGVTLLVDAEVTVFTSLNRADYPCPSSSSSDCTPIITVATGTGSGIMGYGVIDGRGGQSLNGESVSWWTQTPLDPRPRMIQLVHSDNFTLYKITLQNSPKFHVFGTGNFLTVWDVKITAPTTSPNTDGIDPSGSHDITITNSFISDGDDHIAIKAGVGHVSNVTISHNRLFQGHGVSIGSETNAGAESVLVTDVVMDGASALNQNVIRIKSDSSKGGEVKNITYENICAQNPGHPLVFDPFNSSSTGTLFPNMHDILVHNMHVLNRQNSSTVRGYFNSSGVSFPLGITLNNVELDGFKTTDFPATQVNHVNFTLGPDPVVPVNPGIVSQITTLAGTPSNVVNVANNISNSNPSYACAAASFVYLAGELFAPNSVVSSGNLNLETIVQPIVSGAAQPTGSVSLLEGANTVASAHVAGRMTPLQITGISDGTHVYTAQYSGDAKYSTLTFGSYTLHGTTLTLTPSSPSVVYGTPVTISASVQADTGIPSGTLTLSDGTTSLGTFTLDSSGTASFTATLSAGTHMFTASYSGSPGFNVSTAQPLSVVVTPAPLTITANNATTVYGAPVPTLSFTANGFVNGDTLANLTTQPVVTTAATAGSPDGKYPITVSGATDPDYAISFISGTLTITPAALTIIANSASKVLHAANPNFTFTASGFVNGDTVSALTVTPTCSSTATIDSPVGSYPITCSGGSASNYTLSYVPGTLSILYSATRGHAILPPIDARGTSVFEQGRTVPAMFAVYDANGISIGTPGVVSSFFLTGIKSGSTTTTVQEPVETDNPDKAFRFDPLFRVWIFNISTRNLAPGNTYIYTINLNDSSTITFQFALRERGKEDRPFWFRS